MANEDKSSRYHRLRRQASLLGTVWQVVFLLALMVTGGSAAIRSMAVSGADGALAPAVVLYVLTLALLCEVVRLPLAFYQGVVLERRYGLSKDTTARWWADHARAAVVGLAALVAASLAVVGLLEWSPEGWWVAAAVCFTTGLVLIAQFAPVVLLPIFDAVKPLENPALQARLLALASRAGTPALGVFEWQVGHRTRKANAALVGIGRTRRILVSDTLLAGQSGDEIEAILAHELAHHVYGDLWTAILVEAALVVLGFYFADVLLTASAGRFGLERKADIAGLPLLALAAGGASLALMPLAHAVSRAHERRADRYALDMTQNPAAFISAVKRLAATNLAEERPSPLVEFLFHTHPSIASRIDAARRRGA